MKGVVLSILSVITVLGCQADGWYAELTPSYSSSDFVDSPSRVDFHTSGAALTVGYRFGTASFHDKVLAAEARRARHEATMERMALTALAANPDVDPSDIKSEGSTEGLDLGAFAEPETIDDSYRRLVWIAGLCLLALTLHFVGALKWALNVIRPSKQTENCNDDS